MAKDPVTPDLYQSILRRDGRCVAPTVDPNQSGTCSGRLTLDHVKDQPMMGKRAPSDRRHLVTLCEKHHLWTSWATSNRPGLRRYLADVEEDAD